VTLEHSENEYLKYPVNGVITVLEFSVSHRIISAVFRASRDNGSLSAPVRVINPKFKYPADLVGKTA
jgi:hypothetical protein